MTGDDYVIERGFLIAVLWNPEDTTFEWTDGGYMTEEATIEQCKIIIDESPDVLCFVVPALSVAHKSYAKVFDE